MFTNCYKDREHILQLSNKINKMTILIYLLSLYIGEAPNIEIMDCPYNILAQIIWTIVKPL